MSELRSSEEGYESLHLLPLHPDFLPAAGNALVEGRGALRDFLHDFIELLLDSRRGLCHVGLGGGIAWDGG